MVRSNIRKLYFVRFLASLHFFGAVSIPFFIDWVGISYTQLFLLEAWFVAWIFFLEVPTGVIADRYGRKVAVVLGIFCAAISFAIFGLSKNYAVFFAAEFVGALGGALLSGADNALLYDTLVQLRQKAEARVVLAKYEAASMLGMLIAFPIGSLIGGASLFGFSGLPITMLLTSIFALAGLLVALTLREPRRRLRSEDFVKSGVEGFRFIFRNRKLRSFALNSSLISAATFFMFWLYQPLAGRAGIPVAYYGFISASFLAVGWLLLSNLSRIERLVPLPSLLFLTAVVPGLLYFVLAATSYAPVVVLGVMLIAVLRTVREPALNDFMNRHIRASRRATVLSGVSMLRRGTIFVFYPLVGVLADLSMTALLLFLGVLTLVFAFATRIEAKELE